MKEANSLDELTGARYKEYIKKTHAQLKAHEGEYGDRHFFKSLIFHTLWGSAAEVGVIFGAKSFMYYFPEAVDKLANIIQFYK
jgi:hypothetical protein